MPLAFLITEPRATGVPLIYRQRSVPPRLITMVDALTRLGWRQAELSQYRDNESKARALRVEIAALQVAFDEFDMDPLAAARAEVSRQHPDHGGRAGPNTPGSCPG